MSFMILIGITIAIAVLTLILFKNKLNKHFLLFLKIITVVFCAVGFFRFMLSDSFIWVMKNSSYGGRYYNATDYLQSFLRWALFANYAILPMAVFFKSNLWRNIAVYFCLPLTIVSTFFYGDFMQYFLSPYGRSFHFSPEFRYFFFGLELVLAMLIPILIYLKLGHRFKYKSKTEWKNFLIALPLILLQLIPIYLPQSLIGHTTYLSGPFSLVNSLWIGITVLQIVLLYYYFRFKDYNTRNMLVTFLALALFYTYNSMYLMGFSIPRLPIQLCNLGSYLILLAMITKNIPLFNFAFLANIVGALIAMLMPDISGGILGFWNVHFMMEHMLVLIVPVLAMLFNIFPRLTPKAFKHFVIGFTIYFMFCLVVGTILNGFSHKTGYTVNYFYIFDLQVAYSYFPFLRWTEQFQVGFKTFFMYPAFQSIIYLGFIGLVALFYLLVQKMYAVVDDGLEMHKSRLQLMERFKNRKLVPVNIKAKKGDAMVKIKKFSKTYGNSPVKAVNNLSLELKKGEIFGFLGPNGSGKSTTIKTLVGILPLDEGEMYVNNVSISKYPLKAKQIIGYVPDNHAVFERLTGREYVNHIANMYNVSTQDMHDRCSKYLKIFKLEHAFDHQIKSYSHGMKQKISVIAALVHNPKLWVLDEPLTGLDPQSAFQLKQAMKKHAEEGNTVFFSSHILDVVENLCDRCCIIKKGELQGVYDVSELRKEKKSLEELFMRVIYEGENDGGNGI